ncbi:FAD-dependent oxidoreductase [Rhodobacter sp. NTK016B]|uniref:FAD-dependent oxidoreductase n=1 Tax=Rhodobacter sp. NTK016B TaxID=2759676 RepID=UPI001A8DA8D9|nr:FAD-dependent oxidoreductase [Rhodobacter sp. NTK016B]MBN8292439.1 FAD-dependent oxidoreductase [Rhodobacter sp. NTK016B]
MTDKRRILVVGGGFSGMSAAILLAEAGNAVDLVEIDAGWRSYGAGISLNGAIFRVFHRLGILEPFKDVGAMTDGVEMRNPADAVVAQLPTPALQEGATGNGGVMRPVLGKLLSDKVRATATNVRLGISATGFDNREDGVTVSFSDGTTGEYDLVIGADGLYSSTRAAIFPDAPAPRYIGQAVWRAVLPLPEGVNTVTMWIGSKLKYGVNAVSDGQAYLFVTEDRPTNERIPEEAQLGMLKELLERFPAKTVQDIAAGLNEHSHVIYRPLEQMLMPRPWHKGRVVLIGDAVHATTPHMAAGAMIGMEDAVVLADELASGDIETALSAFQDRRWERCRMVVENSGRLAEIEQGHGTHEEHTRLMGQTLGALAAPI